MAEDDFISPDAFGIDNEGGSSVYVLTCEHASSFIPDRYRGLGLKPEELKSHIAWDIGAIDVARRLVQLLDAPLIAANYSRLLIDLNRPLHSATSIPLHSERTSIPGNQNLSEAERHWRIASLFEPFQRAVTALLDRRLAAGRATRVIGIHSFTPVFDGLARPMEAGILYRNARNLGDNLIAALGGKASGIEANQPYQIEDDSDYTVPVHGEARGLDAVLVEIRQDLIEDELGARKWAERLAGALRLCQ